MMHANQLIIDTLRAAGFAHGNIHAGKSDNLRRLRFPGLDRPIAHIGNMQRAANALQDAGFVIVSYAAGVEFSHDDFIGGLMIVEIPDAILAAA